MRRGRSTKKMKMPGICEGPRWMKMPRMSTTVGGLVNCWRLIVKRRGSTQNGKNDAAVACLVAERKEG